MRQPTPDVNQQCHCHYSNKKNTLTLKFRKVNLPVWLIFLVISPNIQTPQRRVKLSHQISSELPQWVLVDEPQLKQVLLNILENAIKFTERGEVRLQIDIVALNQMQVTVKFQIIDSGIEISPADQKKLFSWFEQVQNPKTQAEGLGIGLAISQRIIQKMGGNIEVESQVGQGSRF